MPNRDEIIVFGGTAGTPLVEEICAQLDLEPGKRLLKRFGNGEVRLQLEDDVRGKDVFIVNPLNPPAENAMEMILLARTAAMASANRVTIVPTVMGYDRQERRTRPREPISAKVFVEMLKASAANRALLFDLHSEAIVGFFEPEMIVDHLYGSISLIPYLRKNLSGPFTVASPDAGGVARARKYAQLLGVSSKDLVIFAKDRPEPGEVDKEAIQIIGNVEGKSILIVDDMIDSGGTIVEAAKAAKEKGAREIYACATHAYFTKGLGVFPKDLFKEVIVTNSVYRGATPIDNPNNVQLTTCSIAPLLARAIGRINAGRSISKLFLHPH